MPLPLASLDTRTWAELMRQARLEIPRYSDQWTDHNAHDPGITLLELFAWLSEMMLFRLDRPSPAAIRTFLRWAGVVPVPALPARTGIVFRTTQPPGPAIAAGTPIIDGPSSVVFSTDAPVSVSGTWLELSPAEGTQHGILRCVIAGHERDLIQDATKPALAFKPLGPNPQPDDAFLLGFDAALGVAGEQLSLFLWAASWLTDEDVIRRLIAELASSGCAPIDPAAPPPWWRHPSVVTSWEYQTPAGWQPLAAEDETRALTLTGGIRLVLPADHQAGPDGRYWIRCRLINGSYDCPPNVQLLAVNAVSAHHRVTISGPEALGASDGGARQRFSLSRKLAGFTQPAPGAVMSGTVQLDVGGSHDWVEVANDMAMGPDSPSYLLDRSAATIIFGDGRYGRVPPAGSAITALSYQVGAGAAGNIPAGSLSKLLAMPAGLTVYQPVAAAGGSEAETLDQTHGRALDQLASPTRAVTVTDIESLARSVPGLAVARAHAIVGHDPLFPCITVPGAITVVVVPACGDRPRPDDGFLKTVRAYLAPRRPVTTEFHVMGPTYARVTVRARIHVKPRSAAGLAARAQTALDGFFHPLTGGPDMTGWPFGRAVYEAEIMAALVELDGVQFVDQIGVIDSSGQAIGCSSLCLLPSDLVDSGKHQLEIVEGTS